MKRYTVEFATCWRCPRSNRRGGKKRDVFCYLLGRNSKNPQFFDPDCPLPDAPEPEPEDKEKKKP